MLLRATQGVCAIGLGVLAACSRASPPPPPTHAPEARAPAHADAASPASKPTDRCAQHALHHSGDSYPFVLDVGINDSVCGMKNEPGAALHCALSDARHPASVTPDVVGFAAAADGACTHRGSKISCGTRPAYSLMRDCVSDPFTVGADASREQVCGHRPNGTLMCQSIRSGKDLNVPPDFRQVAVARAMCGVTHDGVLRCDGAPAVSAEGITMLEAGRNHFCAVDRDGVVACWGDNSFGQVGVRQRREVRAPSVVALPGRVQSLALGSHHSCAALEDDTIHCWGDATAGQASGGAVGKRRLPRCEVSRQRVPRSAKIRSAELGYGGAHVDRPTRGGPSEPEYVEVVDRSRPCAEPGGGEVFVESDPVQVPGISAGRIAAGAQRTCGIDVEGVVHCWGGSPRRFRAIVAELDPLRDR